MLNDVVLCVGAAGTGAVVGAGVAGGVVAAVVSAGEVCATPAAESTQAFMFVIDARALLSLLARCTATIAAFAESVFGRVGETYAVNCALAAMGVRAAKTSVKQAARKVT